MSTTIEILALLWVFIAVCGFLAMALSFGMATSDQERDELRRAAGLFLIWPAWLARAVWALIAWRQMGAAARDTTVGDHQREGVHDADRE